MDLSDPAILLFMSVTLSFLSFLFLFIYLSNKNKLVLLTLFMQVILSSAITFRVMYIDFQMQFTTFLLCVNILLTGVTAYLFYDRRNLPGKGED